MKNRPRVPWSRGDKFLLVVLGLILPLGVALFFWGHALDQNPVVTVPAPAMPAVNARDYYLAAANALVDGGKIDAANSRWDPRTKPSGDQHYYSPADKAALVAENARAVQLLRQGFQYPYQETPFRSFSATFPHYQKIRRLARFLSLQGQSAAARGDWEGAISADLDAVQLGETLPRGGPLIGMLVGDACQSIGRRPAWKAVDSLNATQARAAARRLETIRAAHVPFADVLQEEKWGGEAGLLELMRQKDWPSNFVGASSPDEQDGSQDGQSAAKWQMATRIRLAGKRTILTNYVHYMDQSIANARQPYAAHPPDPPLPSDPLGQTLLPAFTGARFNEVKADAQNALLLTTFALRAYKMDHGAYPPTLAALVPGYLQTVPDDPFALSGPLRYKPSGTKYLLYSVGPDGKDDGGLPIFDRTQPAPSAAGGGDRRRQTQPDSRGDVVAGVNVD